MKNKACAFILPYFGRFNNYFPLFLKSFAYNTEFDLLIFTDNDTEYSYPSNVKVFHTTLDKVREMASEKLGFNVCLNSPYKLCDYKPAYGFLFEEYIKDYKYWGHCDCDLVFGNINQLLIPLINEGYDKLFAAGHLTLYKNTEENNRRFMKAYNGRLIYKDIFTSNEICVFDEDVGENNIHRIFLEDNVKVFEKDISMNITSHFARFRHSYYSPEKRRFTWEPFKCARYYWNDGDIVEAEYDSVQQKVKYTYYIYVHLQLRKMRMKQSVMEHKTIQILPDRFVPSKRLPANKKEMKVFTIGLPYLYWFDVYIKKIRKKFMPVNHKIMIRGRENNV